MNLAAYDSFYVAWKITGRTFQNKVRIAQINREITASVSPTGDGLMFVDIHLLQPATDYKVDVYESCLSCRNIFYLYGTFNMVTTSERKL